MTKRLFDVALALVLLILLSPLMLSSFLLASLDTRSCGLFIQSRIGRYARPFHIYKIKTVHDLTRSSSGLGRFLRRTKLDELPQLFNILRGDMSFVGPRPDLPGYYDTLKGEERKILDLKPGLTSEAGLKYYNEDALLAAQQNPLEYNDKVLFPDKVRLNLEYYHHRSFWGDLKLIWRTVFR